MYGGGIMQELQGVIDNIVFQSEDNQFSVFRVKTDHEGSADSFVLRSARL